MVEAIIKEREARSPRNGEGGGEIDHSGRVQKDLCLQHDFNWQNWNQTVKILKR